MDGVKAERHGVGTVGSFLQSSNMLCMHPLFCDVVDAVDEHLRLGNGTLHDFRIVREISGIGRVSGFAGVSAADVSDVLTLEKTTPIDVLARCLQVHRLLYQSVYCGGERYEDLMRYVTVDGLQSHDEFTRYKSRDINLTCAAGVGVWWTDQILSTETIVGAINVVERFVLSIVEWNISVGIVGRYETGGADQCEAVVSEIITTLAAAPHKAEASAPEMAWMEEIAEQSKLGNLKLFNRLQEHEHVKMATHNVDDIRLKAIGIMDTILNAGAALNKLLVLVRFSNLICPR